PDLEARVRTLEEQVARLTAGGPQKSPLEAGLESLQRLRGSEAADAWNQPAWKFHDTSIGGAAPGRATLFVNGSQAPGNVIAFSVKEGMSELNQIDVSQQFLRPEFRPLDLGAPATLAYTDATGQAFFHGEVSRVTISGTSDTSVY